MKTVSAPQASVFVFPRADLTLARPLSDATIGEWEPSTGILRGLCVNCDHRYYCIYPKPPGGVWSCDEYV